MKKLMILAALLGTLMVSSAAEAYEFGSPYRPVYSEPLRLAHNGQYYPLSCFRTKVDPWGRHTTELRSECRYVPVYEHRYVPRPYCPPQQRYYYHY